jgi:tetratricopeptide (TPR) repeat protein
VVRRQIGASVALLVCGCAQIPWANDPSAEPPKLCAAKTPAPYAESLYCRGLYGAAAASFAEDLSGENPHATPADRVTALRWLVYIYRRFPGWDWIVDVVGQTDWSELDRPELADVRDDLHLLAARFEYRHERFDETVALLATIPEASPLHARAALLAGAVHVRAGAQDLAQAAFAEALRAASAGSDPKRAGERDLAALSLARAHYSMQEYAIASRYYESIPLSSPYGFAAAVEGGWALYRMNDFRRALILVKSLEARSREVPPETMAEAFLLEANLSLHTSIDTMEVTRRFHEFYTVLWQPVLRLSHYEPDALFDLAFSLRSGGPVPPTLGTDQTLRLLVDLSVARRFDELDELSREEASLGPPIRWVALRPDRVALIDRREAAAREAGELLQRRVEVLVARMVPQIKEAIGIEIQAQHTGIEDGKSSPGAEALE